MYNLGFLIGSTPTVAENVISALQTGFQTIANDMGTVMTTIVPVALTIMGAGIVLKFGVRWFKRITGQS